MSKQVFSVFRNGTKRYDRRKMATAVVMVGVLTSVVSSKMGEGECPNLTRAFSKNQEESIAIEDVSHTTEAAGQFLYYNQTNRQMPTNEELAADTLVGSGTAISQWGSPVLETPKLVEWDTKEWWNNDQAEMDRVATEPVMETLVTQNFVREEFAPVALTTTETVTEELPAKEPSTVQLPVTQVVSVASATSAPMATASTENRAMEEQQMENSLLQIATTKTEQEPQKPKIRKKKTRQKERIKLSKKDRQVLLRIVEAEATGENIKGKMLVANVVLNRVNYKSEFPDNVTDVVFDHTGGICQFSPVDDGRYWTVKISKETKEAVHRVLCGEDVSRGALYFMARRYADRDNVAWFDSNLKYLFSYGAHDFFSYAK